MTELFVLARHTVRAGDEAEVFALLLDFCAASRAEPGCLEFDAYRKVDDESSYVLVERYVSAEAFEAHRETPHFLDVMQQQIAPRLAERSFTRFGPEATRSGTEATRSGTEAT